MKSLLKVLTVFALFLSFSFATNAQCVPTQSLVGPTTICEGSTAVYYMAYATQNSGSVSLAVSGGTILRTINRPLNPKEAIVAVVVRWNTNPGTSNSSGAIDINESASGCTASSTVNITLLDSTNGACN